MVRVHTRAARALPLDHETRSQVLLHTGTALLVLVIRRTLTTLLSALIIWAMKTVMVGTVFHLAVALFHHGMGRFPTTYAMCNPVEVAIALALNHA